MLATRKFVIKVISQLVTEFDNRVNKRLQEVNSDVQYLRERADQLDRRLAHLVNVVDGLANVSSLTTDPNIADPALFERLKSLQAKLDSQIGGVCERPIEIPDDIRRRVNKRG